MLRVVIVVTLGNLDVLTVLLIKLSLFSGSVLHISMGSMTGRVLRVGVRQVYLNIAHDPFLFRERFLRQNRRSFLAGVACLFST